MNNFHSLYNGKLFLVFACFFYVFAISSGAQNYLPHQIFAVGIFKEYSYEGLKYLGLSGIAILTYLFFPKKYKVPSDIYLVVFNVFLVAPALTLCLGTENLINLHKVILIATLIVVMMILQLSRKLKLGKQSTLKIVKNYSSFTRIIPLIWCILFAILTVKYHGLMSFRSFDNIYIQRELTSVDVRGAWGYLQLYFSYVFSTLLIAHGLTKSKLHYFLAGSSGYVLIYLITAEKSTFLFIIVFLIIYYLSLKNISLNFALACFMVAVSIFIYVLMNFENKFEILNIIAFLLFTRLVAIPGQFIIDYYKYFSENGYTYFSQIRGFDLFLEAPKVYFANPKWPQTGWIVAAGEHNINSNSNATFIAADGAASFGAIGMILIAIVLMFYLIILNNLSYKVPKLFWVLIAAQQALLLVSASFFSVLLSYGGLFYLLSLILYNPVKNPSHD